MPTLPAPGDFALASLARDVERLERSLADLSAEPDTAARRARAAAIAGKSEGFATNLRGRVSRLRVQGLRHPDPQGRDRADDVEAARRRLSDVARASLSLCGPRPPQNVSGLSEGVAHVASAVRDIYPEGDDATDEQLEAGAQLFGWEKDSFLEWAGGIAGWSKTEARRQLDTAGLLVKGTRGVRAAGLAETIRLILRVPRG